MNRICPRHCHATDKNILRCPKCGELMQETRMSQEEIIEETRQRQVANRSNFLNDVERITNSKMRSAKEFYDNEEKRYFNQLRKSNE